MVIRKNRAKRRPLGRINPNTVVLSVAMVASVYILFDREPKIKPVEGENQQVFVAKFDTVRIPVPVKAVSAGSRIGSVEFSYVDFPYHQLPEGAISDLSAFQESLAVTTLPARVPIFPENLTRTLKARNAVIERIPPGMRAMTVRVDIASAVEGWASSGSIVDVLLITNKNTTVVAEKVKVLSVERSVATSDLEAAPIVPNTVTLLVSQEQCLAINTSIPLGRLAFALRGTEDNEGWVRTQVSADSIQRGSGAEKNKALVQGVISVSDNKGKRSFALTDGRWIPTEKVPSGFLIGQ